MTRSLFKDIFREMRRSFFRFGSILAIVALGVTFYTGICQTSPDMLLTGEQYRNEFNLFDIRMLSTFGVNDDDIAAIRAVPGIDGAMPAYSTDVLVSRAERSWVARVHSLSEGIGNNNINRLWLQSGALPSQGNEVVCDVKFLEMSGYRIGDHVGFIEQGDGDKIFTYEDFVIVGAVNTPYYISYEKGSSAVGNGAVNGYFYALKEAFDQPAYSEVFLTLTDRKAYSPFDEKMEDKLSPLLEELEAVGLQRSAIRYDEVRSEARQELDDAHKEYEDGLADYQEALDGLETLADKKVELDDAQKELDQQKKEFPDKIAEGQSKLDDAAALLSKSRKDLTALKAQIDALTAQAASLPDGEMKMTLLAQMQGMTQAYDSGMSKYRAGRTAYNESVATFEAEKADGEAKLAEGQEKIDDGYREVADRTTEINEKIDGVPEKLADAKIEIEDGEQKYNDIKKPEWFVLSARTNVGVVTYHQAAQKMEAIGMVFPIIFFLVAILVSLTALTRMVEEERSTIGIMKALGYNKAAIASKYLIYAIFASVIGSAIGTAVGSNLLPRIIFNAYAMLFAMPPLQTPVSPVYATIASVAMIGSITVACFAVCVAELLAVPASLMRPKAPKEGKTVFLQRISFVWNRLSFIHKVTVRNLFRYKKRFLMTTIGIAGCTALLFTGFGLRDSIGSIVDKQYAEIDKFGAAISLKKDTSDGDIEALEQSLAQMDNVKGVMRSRQHAVTVLAGGEEMDVSLAVVPEPEKLSAFINMHTRVEKTPVPLTDEGVVISEKLSHLLKLGVGDTISLSMDDDMKGEAKITGIFENYVFHYVYMTDTFYQTCFRETPAVNQLLLLLSDISDSAQWTLSHAVQEVESVSSISFSTARAENFSNIVRNLVFVVLVLIVSAMALAFVVLFNLNSINIEERKRELATIKLLGFYNREVASYIFRENFILTAIGALAGLVLGIFVHQYVTRTAEVDMIMFSRTYSPLSFVYSFALTMVFAVIVNLLMCIKLNRINMADSLKSVE